MKLKIIFSIILLLILNTGCATVSGRSNLYVDSVNGNDSNSGRDAQNAIKTLSRILEMTLVPGDTIFLKKGSVWFEELLFPFSGSEKKPIVVTSYGSGNKPKIDGQKIRKNNIYFYEKNFIELNDLHLSNAIGSGAIRIAYGKGIIVANCDFIVTGHGGVFIETSSDCIIRNNEITSPRGINYNQTDGIYSQRNDNILIEQNRIHLMNDEPRGHLDGIQSFLDKNIIIKGNYIYQDNIKTNAQGIYATNAQGKHLYINNIVYCPNTLASVVGFRNLDQGFGSLELYNNTLKSRGSNNLYVTDASDIKVKNNIFISTSAAYIIKITHPVDEPENINHNLYFREGEGTIVNYQPGGGSKSLTQWQREGFDINSFIADPLLDDDLYITSDSPAIDAGESLIDLDIDFAGKPRFKGKSVDIGAYEYR